jgi:hypothetical protein
MEPCDNIVMLATVRPISMGIKPDGNRTLCLSLLIWIATIRDQTRSQPPVSSALAGLCSYALSITTFIVNMRFARM